MEDVKKPLTAEERRERRMKKILENSGSRMNRILSNGSDENGTRLPPALEGGEGFKLDDDSSSLSTPFDSFVPQIPQLGQNSPQNPPVEETKLARFVDISLVALLFGVLCRFVMLYSGPINIGFLWFILYTTIVAKFSTAGLRQDQKGELAAVLGALGNEHFVTKLINIGFLAIEFLQSTITFCAGFISIHLIFEMYDFSQSDFRIAL